METIKRFRIPIIGSALIISALLVATLTLANTAGAQRGTAGCHGTAQGGGGMMGGMMGGNMGKMMADVDRHFIEQMIPHHEDAIAMADLALQKSQRPEIKKLATDIKRVQQAEIDQMRALYKQWFDTEVPSQAGDDKGMMGNGSGSMMGGMMDGMMGSGSGGMGMDMDMGMDLDALANAPDFDKAFIERMIPHHRMALMMSNMVLMNGERAELQTLVRSIITGQSREIEQMQTWYKQWYGTSTPTP